AELAARFAAAFGLAAEAYIAGLLHDLGKYQHDFQNYLKTGKPRTRHAIHGAVLQRQHRLIANVIASHHSGLHNESDLDTEINNILCDPVAKSRLRQLLDAYRDDGLPLDKKLAAPEPPQRFTATEDLRLRLLLSALADADYLDTEAHFFKAAGKNRPPPDFDSIAELAQRIDARQQGFASRLQPSSLDKLRSQIAMRCQEAGENSPIGAFSLTVPTGGGKTLASAAFALHHARRHGFKRVIYVIPYTSIIEQNARVFASVFGAKNVLEHHSLADWRKSDENDEDANSPAARWRMIAENWDAPFIVTTNVQFFESLHSHRPSAVRKIHRILDSVVLFDECQTFPPGILSPTLETLRALQAYGRASLVFCTATQPAFGQRAFFPEGFPAIQEIIPAEWQLHSRPEFVRTRIHHRAAPLSIAEFAKEFAAHDRALVVVNTRRTARELFSAVTAEKKIDPAAADTAGLYHLSTFMCPAHRQAVLDAIRIRLATPGCRCLVISTQLIEAGVDCDFPRVYRDRGPLDSDLQAGGRCNREGRLMDADGHLIPGQVTIINLSDAKLPKGAYSRATLLASKYLPSDPDQDADITPEAIHAYFREFYHDTNRDEKNIAYSREQQLHRKVGQDYRWIDEDEPSVTVLTAYNEIARAWIAALDARGHEPPTRHEWRNFGPLCLNLRNSEVENGIKAGTLYRMRNGVVAIQKSYEPSFGYNPADILTATETIF
ncbi:MAG: CRISPR-associated endonuclease Cas3'', partial [Opitutaceae bacterium]|nr:CRISPR-associated endonuclease Cas3'' [Opitutaceae bacterium]